MMDQAEKAREFYLKRGEGDRIPIGIYHVVGSPLASSFVYLRLADFESYFDPLLKAHKLAEEVRVAAGL